MLICLIQKPTLSLNYHPFLFESMFYLLEMEDGERDGEKERKRNREHFCLPVDSLHACTDRLGCAETETWQLQLSHVCQEPYVGASQGLR